MKAECGTVKEKHVNIQHVIVRSMESPGGGGVKCVTWRVWTCLQPTIPLYGTEDYFLVKEIKKDTHLK